MDPIHGQMFPIILSSIDVFMMERNGCIEQDDIVARGIKIIHGGIRIGHHMKQNIINGSNDVLLEGSQITSRVAKCHFIRVACLLKLLSM